MSVITQKASHPQITLDLSTWGKEFITSLQLAVHTILFHTTRTKDEGCETAHACSGNYHSNSSHRSLYDNKCKGANVCH